MDNDKADFEWLKGLARKGATLGSCGEMCGDCAFKVMRPGDEALMSNIVARVCCGGILHCHTSEYKDAGKICAGFLYARKWVEFLYGPDEPQTIQDIPSNFLHPDNPQQHG